MKKELSSIDVEDLIVGATLFGVGGGGNPQNGLRILKDQLDAGNRLMVWTLDEFSDAQRFASPYFVGSVAPETASAKKAPKVVEDPIRVAFGILENHLESKISATIASEIGGGNSAASLAIAAKLGIPAVDGDLMGRAGPELHQSTIHILGLSMVPAGIASETGNEILVRQYASIDDYEAVARYASVVSGGHVAVVDSPISAFEGRKCIVQGTISKSIELGRVVSEAVAEYKDPVASITTKLENGQQIFAGTLSDYTWKNDRGFLFGDAHVKGSGTFSGKTLRTWIMNEHIMCWIDEKPAVMPPDLIMFVNPQTGQGITNTNLKNGVDVKVVGSSIDSIWRTPAGLKLFGPRRFGFNIDYVPFEELYS
ncbi:MAG TPA: DUF917 domain-containing protein [Nitrososphaerales archaeon]|nr:DUF917 domain-containing protein [Nitrososphaerales archaeon]